MIHPGCPGLVKLRRVQPPTKQVEASVPYYPFLSRMTSFTENNCTADKISRTGIIDSAEMGVSEFQNFRGIYTTFDSPAAGDNNLVFRATGWLCHCHTE